MSSATGYPESTMPGRAYAFTQLTEFHCGCVHRTINEFYLCLTHRAVKTRVEELVTNRPPSFRPPPGQPLINTGYNSLQTRTTISHPRNPFLPFSTKPTASATPASATTKQPSPPA